MVTYSFSKDPVTISLLADEIIEKGLPASIGITHNPGQLPNDLHIEFSSALSGAQQADLASVVTNHVADPPPVPVGGVVKPSVRAATTAALPANTRFGDLMIADLNGALGAQDGVTLAVDDRVLVKDEAAGADNGLWSVMDLGSGSTPWKLRRTTDARTSSTLRSALTVFVEEGAVNGGQEFSLGTANPVTVNTTALQFNRVGGSMPIVGASGNVVWATRVTGDSQNRLQLTTDGQVGWGPGNAAVDTYLSRSAAGVAAFGEVDGASPHGVEVYNTRSSSGANYEKGVLSWTVSLNTLSIGTLKAGSGSSRNVRIYVGSTNTFTFATSAFVPNTDNSHDVGSGSNRIRSIYWGTQALPSNGTAADPAYSYNNANSTGTYYSTTTNGPVVSVGGEDQIAFLNGSVVLRNDVYLAWSSGAADSGVVKDTRLYRDAANTLAQRNGTNSQTFRVYNTFTDSLNHERLSHYWLSNAAWVQTEAGGTGIQRGINIGGAGINFRHSGSSLSWKITTSGHLTLNIDNTYDAGAPSNRIRSIYWGTQALAPNGSVTTPALAAAANPDLGWYFGASTLVGTVNSANEFMLHAGGIRIASNAAIEWSDAVNNATTAADLSLYRDAANTLAQRNGVNAQAFHIYNTFTDVSNYERGRVYWTGNVLHMGTESAGSGTNRALRFVSSGTSRWEVSTSGHWLGVTDNAYDIGSPTKRPRHLYLASTFIQGTNSAGSGDYRVFHGWQLVGRNSANNSNLALMEWGETIADGLWIARGSTIASVNIVASGGKLGFFGVTAVAQPNSTGQTAGFVAGVGAAVNDDSTFTGGVGTKAYTIGDVVRHIKNLGLVASS